MIKLELTEEMVNIIGAALGELPFKLSSNVIAELQKQISAQKQTTTPTEVTADVNS